MTRFLGALTVAVLAAGVNGPARADEKAANEIVDKAIKAAGGEEKLKKVHATSATVKGTITLNNEDNEFTSHSTIQDLDHYRSEFDGEFNGNKVMGVTVINGNKGWRKFGNNSNELDDESLANEKHRVYLQAIPSHLTLLKLKDVKLDTAGEEKVGDKPALGVKVTGPGGKEFTIYFDKESGLPVKLVARLAGFDNQEYTQESTFSDFKEFDGIKMPTKISSKRDGEKFIDTEVTAYKILDKADPKTFEEPN